MSILMVSLMLKIPVTLSQNLQQGERHQPSRQKQMLSPMSASPPVRPPVSPRAPRLGRRMTSLTPVFPRPSSIPVSPRAPRLGRRVTFTPPLCQPRPHLGMGQWWSVGGFPQLKPSVPVLQVRARWQTLMSFLTRDPYSNKMDFKIFQNTILPKFSPCQDFLRCFQHFHAPNPSNKPALTSRMFQSLNQLSKLMSK